LEAWVNVRFSTASTPEQLKSRVHAALDELGLDYQLTWHLSGEPFLTPRGQLVSAVVDCLEEQLGVTPELSTGGGTSDGRFIAKLGCEIIELGPVNATIHKINECVRVSELASLAKVYGGILVRLLGQN
jgi:succinyl-diaminopimelate desuccinylase